MPDPFESFMDEATGATTGATPVPVDPADPFESFMDQQVKQKNAALPFALDQGSQQNPDEKARNLTLAKHLQLPVETIEADPANAHRLAKLGMLDLDALRTEAPNVAKWLENPNNAAIAHDDIDGLRQIERTARALTPNQPEPDTEELRRAIDMQADAIWEQVDSYLKMPPQEPLPPGESRDGGPAPAENSEAAKHPGRRLYEDFGGPKSREDVVNIMRASMRLPDLRPGQGLVTAFSRGLGRGTAMLASGLLGAPSIQDDIRRNDAEFYRTHRDPNFAESLTEGVAGSLPVLGALIASRGRAASALARPISRTMTADQIARLSKWMVPAEITGLSLAQNVQDREQTPGEAILNALLEGAFTRAGGSFEPFLNAAGATGGKAALEVGKEIFEEAGTAASQDIVSQKLGKNPRAYDFLRTLEATGLGGASGGIMAGAFAIPRAMADRYVQKSSDATEAKTHTATLEQLVDQMVASKTSQRAPGEIATLLETTLGQGAVVFVDAAQFRETFEDPAAIAQSMGIGEEYAAALATDGQVQIPTVKLLQMATTDAKAKGLLKHLRRAPGAQTATEADEFIAKSDDALHQLQSEAKAQATEGQADPLAAEAAEYEADMFRQLDKASPATVDRGAIRDHAKVITQGLRNLAKSEGKTIAEIVELQVKGEFQRALKGEKFDLMDAMIERVRKQELPTDREVSGPSLVDFLRTKGLADKALAGELKQLAEDDRTRKPGERNLIRGPWEDAQGVLHQPIDLDTAAAYAHDRGYIDEATPAALLAALESEIGGTPVFNAAKYGNPEAEGIRESLQNLADMIREAGGDPSMSNKEIRKLLADYEEKQGTREVGQEFDQTEPDAAPMADTIDVDGKKRPTLNSDGKRIAKTEEQVRNFWRWFGDSKVVDGQGRPLVAYHGTTSDFTAFNKKKANPESDLGGGFYFTNTVDDVGTNYAGEGPDLTNKITQLAEQIANENDWKYDDPRAYEQARKKFSQHGGATIPAYLAMKNPAIIGGNRETYLEIEYSESGKESGSLVSLIKAIRSVSKKFSSADADQAIADLLESGETEISAKDAIEKLVASEGLMYAEGNDGKLVSKEIIRQAFEKAGFDGFVDNTVNQKSGSERESGKQMEGLDYDSIHFIAFKPTQIKSAIGNRGTFDPSDPKILNQGTVTAPKSGRLDLEALLKQWRKATGDRTPIGGAEAWAQLEEDSAKVDGQELGQPAYHGTGNVKPYETLRYDMVNAPGGEGTQNEGHGVYVTKAKQAAEFYRTQNRAMLGGGVSLVDMLRVYFKPGRIVDSYGGKDRVLSFNEGKDGDWSVTVVDAKDGNERPRTHMTTPNQKALDAVLEKEAPEIVQRMNDEKGRLYTVDIPDNDGTNYLNWDRHIDEQKPEIAGKIKGILEGLANKDAPMGSPAELAYQALKRYEDGTGADAYRLIARSAGSNEAASNLLRDAGIIGNVYRGDEASGHNNYVIFQDVPVTEYNQPGKKEKRRASIQFTPGEGLGRKFTINLFKTADVSSFLHESGHLFLELYADLAAAPGASDAIKAEHKRILDWLGAKDHASITEDMHEKFARGFERYLMEGVAPASNLRRAFARIKTWMVAIYRSVGALKVELTPEIRNVFDRLLAAEDGTIEVEREHGMDAPLPREVFASDEEHQAAAKSFADSRQGTADRLAGDLLADLTEDRRQKLAAERVEVRADVTNKVDDRPVYQVIAMLQRGELPDGTKLPDEMQGVKLDKGDIVATWGEATLKKLPGPGRKANGGPYVYANEGGQPVEQIARAWGFPSGDAMIEAMIQAPDRDTTIEAETDEEMKRRHPDPMADLPDRARAALATDQRAELFRRELSALGKRAGQTPAPIEVLRQVARDRVAKEVAYKLAPDKHRIAAAKAARRVVDAVSRQQWDEAYRAKVQEVLALELYRASRDAKEASEAGRAYLRGFDTIAKRERIGKAGGWEWTVYGPDGSDLGSYAKEAEAREAWTQQPQGATYRRTNGYLEQIDAVLDGFQLRRASNLSLRRRDAFKAWLDRQANDGEPVDIDPKVIADLGNRNWTDLSTIEQSEVVNAIRNIEHLAQLKNKLLKSSRDRDLDTARNEIMGAIVANQPNFIPDGQNDDLLTKTIGKMVGFVESHRKDSFLARRMDGGVDGGVVWDYLIRSRNEAAGEQETRSAKASVELSALFKEWKKKTGAFLSEIPGTRMRMTLEQRIALALNWGNSQGRQRVMSWLGRGGWTLADAQAVLDSLDKSDWKLVNGIIGQINHHWSDVAALEMRTKGIAPEKVESVPFVTKAGVQPGGYYPIKYDPAKSTKAGNLAEMALAKEMQKAAGANAQTRRGHTKLRAMKVDDLALRFDFGVIGEHLSEVIHDLTHRELTLDQNRLLRDEGISQAIIGRYGRGALDQFVRSATDIATGDQPARYAIERFAKALRINNSAATFGLNLTSALMNLTGFLPALTRVGPAYMAQGVARLFGGNINNGFKFAAAKSATMRNRSQTLMREVADATRQVQPGSNIATVRNAGWYFMTQMQRVVDTVTWTGAYEQALAKAEAEGRTGPDADARAVAIADQTVVDTQGSGRIGDLSGIERGGELAKIFTTFYSYFGVMANLQGSAIGKVYRDPANAGKWMRLVTDTALIWTLPALFASLIKSALQGDERDDEEWYKSLAREQVSYGMGMLIGLREASGLVEGHFGYSGPAGTRGVAAVAKGIGEVFDGDIGKGDAKALSSTVGVFTGLPAVQVNRLIDAIAEDHAQGRDAEAVRRALFGAPRK